MMSIAKYEEKCYHIIKKLESLPGLQEEVFGYRSFKPANTILLTITPLYPIIAVPFPENNLILSMFS